MGKINSANDQIFPLTNNTLPARDSQPLLDTKDQVIGKVELALGIASGCFLLVVIMILGIVFHIKRKNKPSLFRRERTTWWLSPGQDVNRRLEAGLMRDNDSIVSGISRPQHAHH